MDEAVISATLHVIAAGKLGDLGVDDLTIEDLEYLAWSGGASHRRAVARALNRVAAGEVEYLAVRAPGGEPIATLGIDYRAHTDAGTFWQFATHPALQGLGLGTRLIGDGERRIRRRGRVWAILGVEDTNPRARALYERLGYVPWRRERASWQQEDEHGSPRRYETELVLLRKRV